MNSIVEDNEKHKQDGERHKDQESKQWSSQK